MTASHPRAPVEKPQLAAIATAFFPNSHADVILSRWNKHRPGDELWAFPAARSRIVSLHVMQKGPTSFNSRDTEGTSDAYAKEQDVALYPDVSDALTLGGKRLAVDGVILIGEHGNYPTDERGVKRYPRKEIFDEILAVFREAGQQVPIFNDKGFSWNCDWAREMTETARELGVPLFGGSSISFCDLLPGPPPPELLRSPRRALSLFSGGAEVYGFHSLEAALSVLEQRQGGESGMVTARVFTGDAVWREVKSDPSLATLLDKSLLVCGSRQITDLQRAVTEPIGFEFRHGDGLLSTFLMLNGAIESFTLALEDQEGNTWAGRFDMGCAENHYAHFATLNRLISDFMITGIPPSPVERTLLATLGICAIADGLYAPNSLSAVSLAIPYKPLTSEGLCRSYLNQLSK